MNCIIPGKNIKVFARAIHSLAKVGEELYIEPLENALALKTVNSSRSAFASFLFDKRFFDKYNRPSVDNGASEKNNEEDETVRCKIAMSSCLNIFKSVSTLEKTVEKCKVMLNTKDDRLVFKMYCRHGIVKTHNLAFIECESLNAIFNRDNCENSLVAHSKMLCEAVVHFQNNQEEVTLVVSSEKISFKNYMDEESDLKKQMITEVKLHFDEFNDCDINVNTEITFCLKELRAILSFVEAINLPIKISFDTPGKPMSYYINSEGMLEATFVLATLAGDNYSNSQLPSSIRQSTSQTRKRESNKNGHQNTEDSFLVEWDDMTMAELDEMSLVEADASRSHCRNGVKGSLSNPKLKVPNGHQENKNEKTIPSDEDTNSPVIAVQPCQINLLSLDFDKRRKMNIEKEREEEEEEEKLEEEEEDFIPGTPPSKKFKSLFFGNSQTSEASQKPMSVVLALDTDEEEEEDG